MKLIYSVLKNQFLPQLDVEPQQLASDLAMIGHFVSGLTTIDNEIVLNLEIRQNRGDCLGYYGLARDLSVWYNTPLVLPQITPQALTDYQLPITITSPDVKRIQALKISHVKNSLSPDWLKQFLSLHEINSINTIVDLTNYVMFLWGIPNHAFDTAISTYNLIWENNHRYSTFTTLDGTTLNLPPQTLIISNPTKPLSLSFLGGQDCAIQLDTSDVLIEVAVYNRSRVKNDSRTLKTTTEAEIRLDKELDTELVPLALNHLASLICQLASGQVSSQLFDYYPQRYTPTPIEFDPKLASIQSGIDIPTDFALDCLARLGCTISNNLVTPPSIRKDISIPEDLSEEVIRFYGYQKIPNDQPLTVKNLPDVTPKIIYLIESLKDKLVALGYDEIRSWPLVRQALDPSTVVTTQNSINSEYPHLRQSMVQSLETQLDQYQRLKLPSPQFFEISKIFSLINGQYIEKFALGLYHHNQDELKIDLQKLNLIATTKENFAEIILDDLDKPDSYTPQDINSTAVELTSQIITLDANVSFDSPQDPAKLIDKYTAAIDPQILWSIDIVDIFQNKYTFRVSYYNCDDKTAKKVHLSTFNLK